MPSNLPNQITLARLGVSIAFLALLGSVDARALADARGTLQIAFWLFILAALTDAVDGYLARRLNAETAFGRMVDPLVDKILICGAFTVLASSAFWDGARQTTGVAGWMAVVILARELLVSGLRGSAEAAGHSFGADRVGKLKMVAQCLAVGFVIGQLAWNLTSIAWLTQGLVWAAVAITIFSAFTYSYRARVLFVRAGAAPPKRPAPRSARGAAASSPRLAPATVAESAP